MFFVEPLTKERTKKYNDAIMKSTDPAMERITQGPIAKMFSIIILVASVLFFAARLNAEAANPSSYSLIGTIISKTFTGVVINDAKGEQTFYRLYENLPDGMQIIEVRNNSISVKGEDGNRSDVYINHDVIKGGSASQSAYTYTPAPISHAEPGQPVSRKGRRGRTHSSDDE